MKWIIGILCAALLLIGLGFLLTGTRNGEVLSRNPQAAALCREGTDDLNTFRLRDAVEKLDRSLELDPSLAEAAIARTLAYLRLGERENFLSSLAQADSLTAQIDHPRRRMLAQLRLSAVRQSRFHAMGDSVLARLEKIDPDNIFVLVAEAGRAAMAGDSEAAEQAWLRILDKNPNYANSYNMLGYTELNRGNYDKAIEYMQKYAFLAPDLANPHDSLGEVLMTIGRYEEAEKEFLAAVTMQKDFYPSLINLGKVFLARGQLHKGLDILEKVRTQVAGSELEKKVDQEMVITYLKSGLQQQLGRMTAIYIARYPEDSMSAMFRGIRLAHMGQVAAGRAVMDSALAVWRGGDEYQNYPRARRQIDSAAYQFDALVAEAQGRHEAAAGYWERALSLMGPQTPFHETWYPRYRLASALAAEGQPADALAQVDSMLAVNPRLINDLVLKVECLLDMDQAAPAAAALDQLDRSLARADADLPARARAEALHRRLAAMAQKIPR